MKPVIATFDDFFDEPLVAQKEILDGNFENFVSPWDGVTYPGINQNLPDWVKEYVIERLSAIVGGPIAPVAIFARVTSAATGAAPHRIHSDRLMAEFSAHIYISGFWPEGAGTTFWTHVSEGHVHDDHTDVATITRDMHDASQWERSIACQGAFNRVLIHDASFYHSAEPVGGWGDSPQNGRVVVTCFFNKGSK